MSDVDNGCANECALPLRFPQRPGENQFVAHGAGCSCCQPGASLPSDNRPALPHFNYRIGTYGSIREWLLHQINQAPNLRRWTHRSPDDPGIALLEGAAILGDILTFYQDTYANEAYLRTAKWRESISDLVRLFGYRLSPSIGGKAVFAFEIKKDEPVTIPAGFPLKASLEGVDSPAVFETNTESVAYPWLSRFNLFRPLVDTTFDAEFEIEIPEQHLSFVEIKIGERLILGESESVWSNRSLELENADMYFVEAIRELHGTKIYRVKGKLKDWSPNKNVFALRIGRTFHHFGHNGPAKIINSAKPIKSISAVTVGSGSGSSKTVSSSDIPYLSVPFTRPVTDASEYYSDSALSPPVRYSDFPLEMEVQDLVAGGPVVIQARFAFPGIRNVSEYSEAKTLVRTLEKVEPMTMTWGGLSESITRIRIEERISDAGFLNNIPANLSVVAGMEADEADTDEANVRGLLERANAAAAAAKDAADAAAKDEIRAKAEAADLAARADAAINKAAVLTLAYSVAAAALKDNAADATAQATAVAAAEAATAAVTAKSSSEISSRHSDVAAANAATVKSNVDTAAGFATALTAYLLTPLSPGNVHLVDLVLDGLVGGVDVPTGIAVNSANLSQSSANTAKSDAAIAKTDATTTSGKADETLRLANLAKAAAAADADATRRAEEAKQEANKAKEEADKAVEKAFKAKQAAHEAERIAEEKAARVHITAKVVEVAEEDVAAAVDIALEKNRIKNTRMYIGDALFHEVTSPKLQVKAARLETSEVKGATFNYFGTADQVKALSGRQILLEKKGSQPGLLTVEPVLENFPTSTKDFAILRKISLSSAVAYADFPNLKPVTTVFGNVVEADEGKTQPEVVIGSGDATRVFQNFQVPKAPLTYHIVTENSPSETPTAEVYVGGKLWSKVDSFFGHASEERIYIVREDAAGNSWVQFGDGKTGARLPSGSDNVTVIYRTGAGAYGALKDDSKVQALAKLKNLDKVQMPGVATGGAPPENGENAREAAPGKIQSLGRIVSLKDFEAEAAAIPGVTLASAAWGLDDNVPAVLVTVLMDTGRSAEIQAVRDILVAYNSSRGAGRTPILVVEGKRMYVTLTIRYALQAGFRADLIEPIIRGALGGTAASPDKKETSAGLFGIKRRRFGGREYASSVEGTIQNVQGVLWAKVITFTTLAEADDPAPLALPSVPVFSPMVPCDSGHILSLYDKHLFLTAVKSKES